MSLHSKAEDRLLLMKDMEEEKHTNISAAALGLRKGFIFTQTVRQSKRDYTLSSIEIRQAAQLHVESRFECWATAIVKLEGNDEGGTDVHFEAFQLSDQCVKLYKEGWFIKDCPDLDPKLSRMAKDVVILSKGTQDVDNEVLVKILDHEVQFSFLSVLLGFLSPYLCFFLLILLHSNLMWPADMRVVLAKKVSIRI
jgi:nuclear protein localization family protein 4